MIYCLIEPEQKEVVSVEAVRAYYDGRVFIPTQPVNARKNQSVLVTILDEIQDNATKGILLALAGSFDNCDYDDFITALKDTERVDEHEW
jgi:hypothetical protein